MVGPLGDIEVAVHGAAAAAHPAGARYAEKVQVVLQARDAGFARCAHALRNDLDLSVAAGQSLHDAGETSAGHIDRLQAQREHVHRHAIARQSLAGPP